MTPNDDVRGGHPTRPALPADLTAVQADDALIDALAGPTCPPEGVPVERVLLAWRRRVNAEPMTRLVDTDTALAVVARARRPDRRYRLVAALRRVWRGGRR